MEQLFKRYHNVSHTIPVLNVTITTSDITEYARIHSLNIGPIVALLFMGSIMTLVWFYLLVCVCCCLSRRGEASRGTSQVVPGAAYSSPTSPSSSASPLACKIELPSSSIERYDDEQRGNESKNMHRSRSLEEEHRKYSFKSLYIASIILSALLGLAVVSIVIYQSKIDASARILMGDVENLVLDSANALCTSDASSRFCTPQSAGGFVRTAETRASGMLTNLVDLLQSLGEELYPPLNGIIDDLDMAEADLEDIKVYISLIMGNRSRIQEYNNWLFATSPDDEVTPLTAALPKGKLPNVTAEQLTKLDDHQSVIIMTRNTSEDVFGKIQNFMQTDVPDAVTRFNTSAPPGTSTQLLMKPLQNVFEKLLRARSLMLRYYALVYEQGERIEDYLAPKTLAVSVIFLLPFVLQIVFTILNRSNQKGSGHLLTNMCCSYLCSVVFLLLAIIFSLLAVVSGTVCEYHLTLLAKVPVQNVTINDVQLSFTPAVIEDILNCPSYPTAPAGATSGNNFISLLGGEKIFDITSQTDEIIAQVEEARTSFTVNAQIQQSIYQLSILENFTALDFANSSDILSYRLEIDALLEDLPPATMDRDDEVQRASLTAYYLTNGSFSWDSYQESLEDINAILAEAAPIPDGFFSSYTFQTVWNFTQATVEADSAWMDVTFVRPKNYEALIAGLVQMDPFTGAVNTAAKTNIQVHANLSAIRDALRDIQSNIQEIDAAQSNLRTAQTQLDGMFSDLLDRLNGIARNLSLQEEGIRGLASFADSAPDYTKCGFVGNFYREGFQKNFCGNLHNNLSISWPFMLVAASLLFLSFITFSCFLRKPKWYRDPSYSQLEDRNNLTPGRTPRGSTLMIA